MTDSSPDALDMVDEHGNLEVGCLAFFIDMFATFPMMVQGAHEGRPGDNIGVSQSMHYVFHNHAQLYVPSLVII